MDDYGDPMRTVEINRAEAEWRINNRAVKKAAKREHNRNERIIKSFCDYIWKEFKKAEDDQAAERDNDYFSNEDGEMGYYFGKYVAMKKVVESDEFKKLEGLLKKEESNGSV